MKTQAGIAIVRVVAHHQRATACANPSQLCSMPASDKSKVTIYDVADRAGVAISTVSRVLNDSSDVSEKTRARVLSAIEELQFRPDRVAKTLAQQRVRSIAIAVPTFTTPFHNELLKGVRSRLRHRDHDLLLFDLGSEDPRGTLLGFLKRGTVDGLLLAGVAVDEQLTPELKAFRAPVVLVGHHHSDFDCFYWDNTAGAKAAVWHLIEQGHRRIGLIRSMTDSYFQDKRIEGYIAAFQDANLPLDPQLIQHGETEKHAGFSEEHGHEAMLKLLKIAPPITAVFACSDVQAIGAWKAIRDAGMRVPDDISLVGYDDIKTSKFLDLTSINQDMELVGQQAMELLMQRMDNGLSDKKSINLVVPQLQLRRSSDFRLM